MWRILLGLWLATSHTPAQSAGCQLSMHDGGYEGSCGRVFGGTPTFTLVATDSITSGMWRDDARPIFVWRGEMKFPPPRPGGPVELEVYEGGTGVLRNLGGWFPVSDFRRDNETLHIRLDPTRQVAPSDVDRRIVQRAAALLATEAVWDRADDRMCAATDTTWSIYCAMERATVEVAGAFHHRRPAMEVVRLLVEERTVGRNYAHRLMDYNNDKTTRLEDVRSLFAEALAKLKP